MKYALMLVLILAMVLPVGPVPPAAPNENTVVLYFATGYAYDAVRFTNFSGIAATATGRAGIFTCVTENGFCYLNVPVGRYMVDVTLPEGTDVTRCTLYTVGAMHRTILVNHNMGIGFVWEGECGF